MKRARIYQDVNLTPIQQPNPKWKGADGKTIDQGSTDPNPMPDGTPKWIQNFPLYDSMKELGFEEMQMIYDGTLNRAPVWCKDDFSLVKPGELDWTRGGNLASPPQKQAIEMIMHLNNQGDAFVKGGTSHLPIIFDLENQSVNYNDSMFENFNDGKEKIENLVNAVNYAKGWSRWGVVPPVGHYQYPMMLNNFGENRQTDVWFANSGLQDLIDVIDFAAPSFYTINWMIDNPQNWFDMVQAFTSFYERRCKHLPRVAVVCPAYQAYWPEQQIYQKYIPFNNQPVPLEVWKKQLRFLVDRDYDIFVWAGNLELNPKMYANLLAVAELAK
jgi:hypothetical protein